jgi:glycine/D-amino acid oxidase-like deaminating enzyme
VVVGIYSPQDLQVAPKALTQALVAAAKQQGVICRFDAPVSGFRQTGDRVLAVQTTHTEYLTDWVILAAGLGSSRLTERLGNTIPLVPVLGQGIRVKVPETIGLEDFQPVINGDDIHLVPLGNCEYGVAATVEFPAQEEILPEPEAEALAKVWQGAIAFCPVLKTATTLETWYGLRPRPASQAAPIIQPLSPDSNVVLATGHYRNGVLLAPTTAEAVCQYLLKNP